jgi:hypothetical protein
MGETLTSSITHQPVQQQPQHHGAPGQLPASSGYRVTAGILAIVLSFVLSFGALVSLSGEAPWAAMVLSLASLGNLVAGIVILILHRQRLGIGPNVVLGMAIFGIVAGLIGAVVPIAGPTLGMVIFALAIVILWATSASVAREKQ